MFYTEEDELNDLYSKERELVNDLRETRADIMRKEHNLMIAKGVAAGIVCGDHERPMPCLECE